MFKPAFSYFTTGTNSLYIKKWKSISSNDDSEVVAVKNSSNKTPKISISNEIISVKFNDGDYFKQKESIMLEIKS